MEKQATSETVYACINRRHGRYRIRLLFFSSLPLKLYGIVCINLRCAISKSRQAHTSVEPQSLWSPSLMCSLCHLSFISNMLRLPWFPTHCNTCMLRSWFTINPFTYMVSGSYISYRYRKSFFSLNIALSSQGPISFSTFFVTNGSWNHYMGRY